MKKQSLTFLGACALAVGVAGATPSTSSVAGTDFAVRATRVHAGKKVIEDGVILVADGKIQSIGAGLEVPDGVNLVEHDGDVSPGLIALRDGSGTAGENYDRTRAILAEASLAHAFRPDHSDFEALVESGITSVVLAPAHFAVAGGTTAVVKTSGGRVLAERAQLSLSFSSTALLPNRFPTSYGGLIAELDERFEAAQGVFGDAGAGKLPVLIEVADKHEVQRALAFAKKHGLAGALSGASRAGELAGEIKDAGLAVVYRPFDPGLESRSLRSVPALAEAGVLFGFALDAPSRHPASLRLGAAACVREGLSSGAALRALTSDAARIAGVDASVGRLAKGMDADFVLWSGDPIDLGSRVVAVYVDGELAHDGGKH